MSDSRSQTKDFGGSIGGLKCAHGRENEQAMLKSLWAKHKKILWTLLSLRVLSLGLDGFWKLEGKGMEQGHALFFLNVQFFVAHPKNVFLQREAACMGS